MAHPVLGIPNFCRRPGQPPHADTTTLDLIFYTAETSVVAQLYFMPSTAKQFGHSERLFIMPA